MVKFININFWKIKLESFYGYFWLISTNPILVRFLWAVMHDDYNLFLWDNFFRISKRHYDLRVLTVRAGDVVTQNRGMATLTVAERWLDSFMGIPYFGTLFVKHETSTIYGSEKTAFTVFSQKNTKCGFL